MDFQEVFSIQLAFGGYWQSPKPPHTVRCCIPNDFCEEHFFISNFPYSSLKFLMLLFCLSWSPLQIS